MANGWTKYFFDSQQEIGTDQDVSAHRATWRNGRLSGMVGAALEHDGFMVRIMGPGTYWQSDTMEVTWPNAHPVFLRRRVSKLIDTQDTLIRYRIRHNEMVAVFNQELEEGKCLLIPKQWHGQWFVMEYNLKTTKPRYYISEQRV